MSARPDLCGGYHVSGIPTAIMRDPDGYLIEFAPTTITPGPLDFYR